MSKPEYTAPTGGPVITIEGDGEFFCPDCGNRCTRGPNGVEYGHQRGIRGPRDRCPRRPPECDPGAMHINGRYSDD